MLFKSKKVIERVSDETKDEIIKAYLETIQMAYTNQPILAERMIEMELDLLNRRRHVPVDQQA